MSDVHNHPEPENFEALARSAWPDKPPRIQRYLLQDWVDRVRIPAAQISTALARTLLRGAKGSLEDLARAAEKPLRRAASTIEDVTVTLTTDVRHHVVPDRNVLAALEGSDPKLKDEWVVISCHHDHNGADGDQVFNGADDNGSGTVGMLEIAEAYALAAQDGHRPKRSILFASFNSEERGLLGSWAFVERPPVPLDRIVAVLNMDMVGRDEEVPEGGGPRFRGLPVQSAESNRNAVNLLGHSRSASLTQTIEQANAAFGLTLKKVLDNNSSNLLRRSDQWPFLQKRRAGRVLPHRAAPRLPHDERPAREDQLRRRWSGSSAWCTRRAGTWRSSRAARGSMRRRQGRSPVEFPKRRTSPHGLPGQFGLQDLRAGHVLEQLGLDS